MKKLLGVLAALAIAVVATVALFPQSPSDAAMVNGTGITKKMLNADLDAINGNTSFTCYVVSAAQLGGGQTLTQVSGASAGTYDTAFAAYWLSEKISGVVAEQYVADHHLKITPADTAAAQANLAASITEVTQPTQANPTNCQADGNQVLKELPKTFVTEQVQVQAAHEAILRTVDTQTPAEAGQAYFAAHPGEFDTLCLSAIVGAAQNIVSAQTALQQGMGFAEAARKYSQNQGASNGGSIGCYAPDSPSYGAVQTYVQQLKAGETGKPFQANQGVYAIIHVDDRQPAANYAAVASLAESLARRNSQQNASNVVSEDLSKAVVTVNTAYGSWSTANNAFSVVPPASPKA
ncbi:MAG: peptidylprolyl isomerase [Actinomycetota bacterium]